MTENPQVDPEVRFCSWLLPLIEPNELAKDVNDYLYRGGWLRESEAIDALRAQQGSVEG